MNIGIIIGVIVGVVAVITFLLIKNWWNKGKKRRKGKIGERQISKLLRRLNKKDYIVFNDLLLSHSNGSSIQIDHVVVSTRGIFVIETKSHAGRISGGEHSQNWQQHLSKGSKNFYNPLLQNAAHLRILRRLLPNIEENLFISLVVFTEAWCIEIKADDIIEKRRFLADKIIKRTLNPSEEVKGSWWKKGKEVRLDTSKIVMSATGLLEEIKRRKKLIPREDLKEIAKKIGNATICSNEATRRHVNYVKERAKSSAMDIKKGICPRCGGQLVIKKSATGQFIGCENYPACRFTGSIDLIH